MPEGWAWARIDTICVINPRNSLNDSLNVSFVPMSLIDEGYVNSHSSDIRKWSEVKAGFTHLAENDIGIAKITPCFENRKSTIFCNLTNGYGAGTTELYVLRVINSTISQKYLIWIVKTDSFIQGGIQSFSGAVGQQRVRKEYISKYLIPVPPRKEQDRIVHKLNELFALVILLEKEKSSLQISIKQVKAKVLDLAIRGKLVPQDPNDESASMLLESIRAEKEELIKQGKIKWDKQESVIFKGEDNSYYEKTDDTVRCIDEEIPFEIPESWIWTRIRNIASVRGGKRLPKGANFCNKITTHAYIRVTDMKNCTINTAELKYISDEVFAQIKSYTISSKDLYITIAGTIGIVGEVPKELDGMNLTENAVKVCNITIRKKYLCYILVSDFVQKQFQDKTHQVAMPKLAIERILTTLIPIPPLSEQDRITKRLETTITWIDNISIILS